MTNETSPAIAEVLAQVETLTNLPVADHVAVLETVHEKLRAALDSTTSVAG